MNILDNGSSRPVIIASKGAPTFHPANSIESITAAVEMEADIVLCDAVVSLDGVVLSLDPKDLARPACESPARDIADAHKRLHGREPALIKDLLRICAEKDMPIMLQVHEPGCSASILALSVPIVGRTGITIMTTKEEIAAEFKAADDAICVGFAFETTNYKRIFREYDKIIDFYATRRFFVKDEIIDTIAAQGKKLLAWDVDTRDQITEMLLNGRVSGIITARPHLGIHLSR